MDRYWHVGARQPWRAAEVFPRAPGPFLRADRENQLGRELVIGQWGLLPWFAKTPKLTYSTADLHPLMNRMHKPDPKLGPDKRDKRSVVPTELGDVDSWLNGSQEGVQRWSGSRPRKSLMPALSRHDPWPDTPQR
jgi:hypothetical protein